MSLAKPPVTLHTTTLWDYPSQHYGRGLQGSPGYVGATPSHVIWNLLQRYTRAGDQVLDPMCGSGTTLDVAAELGRRAVGFDLAPARPDVRRGDARALPLDDAAVDFAFVDPPYGDHIRYSDQADCIGRLSAYGAAYYDALAAVLGELARVLRPRRYVAVYVCDFTSKKGGFAPVGAQVMAMLCGNFVPIEHVSVVRRNKALKRDTHHRAAAADNSYLRGFNHLIIGKKA